MTDISKPLTTAQKLPGLKQREIAEAILIKREIGYTRVTAIMREHVTNDPGRVWFEIHYDSNDPRPTKCVAVCSLEEWWNT